MPKNGSNTAKKQPRRRGKGKPFRGNNSETGEKDERINRKGRPKSADELRKYIDGIFGEKGTNAVTGEQVTVLRAMILKMALDGAPADRIELLNRRFGKVADAIMISTDEIQKIIDYLPDDMLDRLAKGESLGDVLVAYLTSLGDGQNKPSQKNS